MTCLVYIMYKLMHLKSRTRDMTCQGRQELLSFSVRQSCSDAVGHEIWAVLASRVESHSNCFILSSSIFGYLTSRASSNFLLVGSQIFHVRQQEPGSVKTFDGQLGKARMLGKLYLLGCVISSSDAMIAPPGPWNLLLWPDLLIRTSNCFFATFNAVLCSLFLSHWLTFTWLLCIILAKTVCI